MKKTLLFLFFFLQFLILSAQNPADIDQTFGPYPGFNQIVDAIVTQADGKILVGGNFTTYLGNPENYLIRLNKDGSKDTSFNIGAGFNRNVNTIAIQPDGKILVAGNFTTYNGTAQNRIIRLNADGSKDPTFNISGEGFENIISVIALQTDGKILVGGYFTKFQGSFQNRIIRLNPDGTKDMSFTSNQDGSVLAIVVQSDGKIILGGGFRTLAGDSQNLLVRLNPDGTKDTSFDIGSGFEKDPSASYGAVYTLALQPNGKIVVGGDFKYFKKELSEYVIRLNTDGSKDTSFITENRIGSFCEIYNVLVQTDGKIVVGGTFTEFKGQIDDQNRLIRFNADGTKDVTFKVGTGFNGIVDIIALQNDGQLLIGGRFTTYQGITQNRLVQLNTDGSKDMSFNKTNGLDYSVKTIAMQNDGKIIAGGEFTTYHGSSQNKLIRFNSDGSKDENFNIGTGFSNSVSSIKLQTDQKILVAGDFGYYNGNRKVFLIRLESNGYIDNSFNVGPVIQSNSVIELQSDGKILVAKDFSAPYQQPQQKGLIRLNSDGSNDNSFVVGSKFGTGIIYTLAIQSDGKIIAGGYFTTAIGAAQNYLIRLNTDGSTDTSFNVGSGFNDSVNSVNIQSDGKILIGGNFTKYQGAAVKAFIRLNSDGSVDPTFTIGSAIYPSNPILQKDGKIILGLNRFNSDGSIDNTLQIGTAGFNGNIRSVALQPNGQILVGGDFINYKDNSRSAFLVGLKGTYIATPLISKITPTHIICAGTTGSASIAVSGGKAPYTYLWSNGATTSKITGLAAGDYSCEVTDADVTTVTENFSITTIADTENPTITAPANVSVNANANCTATGITLGTPVTSDNCSVASVTNNAPTTFPLGNTTVIWTVKDASNNTATATQIVTVKDATLPTIIAPNAIIVNVNTNCTATGVLLGNPVTADNCSVASVTNNAPVIFPLGNTTVTWTVKDASNNTATATQIVTVKDVTLPIIKAPAAVIVNTNTNCTATGIVLGTPITADNCSVASVTNNAPAAFPIGETTVTWTVKDGSNNIATDTQLVIVKGIDATITNNVGILTAVESAAIYKWLECNNGALTAIPNENEVSFTPKKTGSYAVEITKNGCTATSICYEVKTLGTKDFDLENSLKLYPNPTKDFVTIEINVLDNVKLKIFDVNGQFIFSKELKTTSNTINISHFASGVYLFEVSNDNGKTIKKVIKN